MDKKYVGITIGPILDTMLDAASPAAMWFSSFLFSDITRRICDQLISEEQFANVQIYSPYYSGEIDIFQDGVGRFHDRIMFSMEPKIQDYEEVLNKIIEDVKTKTAMYFENLDHYDQGQTEQFLKRYIQIYYVIRDTIEENIILDMSDQLSALELMKTFPANNSANPISRLMQGYEEGKNQLIKESRLYRNVRNREALEENGAIRSIEMIASSKETNGLKVDKYFALVNADGDRMGKTLETLKNDRLKSFSQKLFVHTSNASEAIKKFGGMTIYAGGDDLLFLAPVIGNDGKTIFNLCDVIRKEFAEQWQDDGIASPTLSFGISIQYYKAPLYEAMEKSRNMLAASKSKDGKNCTTVHVQKHSGQSIYLNIPNEQLSEIDAFLDVRLNNGNLEETNILHSQIYTLEQYKKIFMELVKRTKEEKLPEDEFVCLWGHMFDNDEQTLFKTEINRSADFLYHSIMDSPNKRITETNNERIPEIEENILDTQEDKKNQEANNFIRMLSTLLRLKKFIGEGGTEV